MKSCLDVPNAFMKAIFLVIFLSAYDTVDGNSKDTKLYEISRQAINNPLKQCGLHKFGCDGRCTDVNNACNGIQNCKDGVDESEELCGKCPDYYFQCGAEACHPIDMLCDGKVDCVDGTDEDDKLCRETCSAPHYFRCEVDQSCIPISALCDRYKDCKDGADESNNICKNPVEMYLTGGRDKSSGIVHVKFMGFWGTICGDKFTDTEAKVICRSLGFNGSASAHPRGFMGVGRGLIWLHNIKCKGDENNIIECGRRNWGFHQCSHLTDVGVSCSHPHQFQSDTEGYQEKCGISPHFTPEFEYELDLPEKVFTELTELPTPSCVSPSNFVEERVRKGRIAQKNTEFPWIADLRLTYPGSSIHICGGAILSEYFVLTAAHCVRWVKVHETLIRVGEYDQDTTSDTEDNFEAEKLIIHPDYSSVSRENDIALVKIKKKAGHGILFGEAIRPVCLPTPDISLEMDYTATFAGWGRTEHIKNARYLRMATIPLVTNEKCNETYHKLYNATISEVMLCAGDFEVDGRDACQGDSGGPLVVKINGRAIVVGLVNWGEDCILSATHRIGVYARVPFFVPWILEQMKNICLPTEDCPNGR